MIDDTLNSGVKGFHRDEPQKQYQEYAELNQACADAIEQGQAQHEHQKNMAKGCFLPQPPDATDRAIAFGNLWFVSVNVR